MRDKEKLRQFQMLVDNKELFQIAAGMALACIGTEEGVDKLLKDYRWYAQIGQAIIAGDVSTVTDEEKEIFIDLHLEILGHKKTK